MDLGCAPRKIFPAQTTPSVNFSWRRLFGNFVGLPVALCVTGFAWMILDFWFIKEEYDMIRDMILHLTLTLTLSTLATLGTAYWLKRQQCRMRLIRIPRLPGRSRVR